MMFVEYNCVFIILPRVMLQVITFRRILIVANNVIRERTKKGVVKYRYRYRWYKPHTGEAIIMID